MNKKTGFVFCLAAALLFTAGETKSAEEKEMANTPKTLVVYFSHSGNTKRIADKIAAAPGAEVVSTKEILFDSAGGNNLITPENEIDSWIAS